MPTVLPSRIEAVTVYRSGALVTRVATMEPTQGAWPRRVCLMGLPLALDDSSVRVRVIGKGRPPEAVDVHMTVDVGPADLDLPAAEDAEVRAASLTLARCGQEVERLEAAVERQSALALPARPAPETRASRLNQ